MNFARQFGFMTAWALLTISAASAHDYSELSPLDPNLRSFLVTLLEDANAANYLDGNPTAFSAAPASLSGRLTVIIETADDADMRWLETADYKELEHPALGRLPSGFILQLLSDLADVVSHAKDHQSAEKTTDPKLVADLARLEKLSERHWGRP